MNSVDSAYYSQSQSASTPSSETPVSKGTTDSSQNNAVKMSHSTPNGYSNLQNHKTKAEGQTIPKKHDSSSKSSGDHHHHKHSDSSKHNSDHVKRKDGDSSKHSSSSSKSKDSVNKVSSKTSNDISKSKEHHSHEKKHHEHSKNDVDKLKKEKASHDSSKKTEKHGEDKHKEKTKEGHSSEHKHKDKVKVHDKHKDKDSKDKIKKLDGHKDKPDKPTEKPKEKSDKPKDKSHDKSHDKPHDKSHDKLHDKSKEKLKEKSKDKSDKPKDKTSEKPKDKSVDVSKVKKEGSPEKKSSSSSHQKDHVKKSSEGKSSEVKSKSDQSPIKHDSAPVQIKQEFGDVHIKEEPSSPEKRNESFSDDDVPLSSRKPVKEERISPIKRIKSEDESDDEPLAAKITKVKKAKTEGSAKKRKADSDDDYEVQAKKPAKKVKKEVKTKKDVKKKDVKKEADSTPTSSPKKRTKKEEEQEVWKWWEEEKHADGIKWRTLEHKGPVFAPLYERVPNNVKFYYDGKQMKLSEVAEEVAGFYGRMLDHEYTAKEVFNTNFFKDWRKVMTPEEREIIKDLTKCNFNDFNVYYKMKSEERKNMSKEEKLALRKQNEELTQEYGFCIIDGHKQKIGNFKIEPPGLFRGRGEHPKMGMLKRRIQPEDVLINIGREAKCPEPPAGHKWKEVRHDNTVTWLASWNENILNSTKYIMLNPSSKLKGEKDWQKYETARKLKNHADRIRKTYSEDFKSKEMKVRQRAVALYFIDKLALRAGNEKDEDTADTVGCCSLRVEHITLDEEKDGLPYVVSFDFLGKDSIRYVNSVSVEKRAFKNLKLFMENKQPGDDLFDRLNTGILNKYLNELMEGLTAKVFRTYNASKTLQEQLDLLTKEDMSIPEKILAYNRANRAVAVLCNHQRSVPKTFSKSMENLKNKIDEKEEQIRAQKKELKQAKADAKNSGSAKDKAIVDKKKKRLQQLEEQLQKLEVQATDKEENKQIALGTSKLNYLDPRISVAWCKKWNVPIEKIYNRTQRDKFRWAIEMVDADYKF